MRVVLTGLTGRERHTKSLKGVVGANGFEPSTSWSRTRCHALLNSVKFCGSEEIENKPLAARALKSTETC
jgi:hypothetical protein